MKTFVYKTLFIFICIFLLFQLTIGAKLKQLNKELTELKSKKNIEIIKDKLRDELRNAISKENYLSPDDAKLINEFIFIKKKFIKYEFINFRETEFIVLEKLKLITKKIVVEKQSYCKFFIGNIYILYLKKNPKIKCD